MTIREGTRFSTASGDIRLENVEVEEGVKFSSASGDIEATSCTGHLSLSSASGDVVLRRSTLIGKGKFSSASGDVELYLDELPPEGLSASSASGNVTLDAADFDGSYTLVMVRNEEHGLALAARLEACRFRDTWVESIQALAELRAGGSMLCAPRPALERFSLLELRRL